MIEAKSIKSNELEIVKSLNSLKVCEERRFDVSRLDVITKWLKKIVHKVKTTSVLEGARCFLFPYKYKGKFCRISLFFNRIIFQFHEKEIQYKEIYINNMIGDGMNYFE